MQLKIYQISKWQLTFIKIYLRCQTLSFIYLFIYLFVIGQEIVPTWNPQNLKFIWGKGSFHYVSHIGHVKFFQKMGIYHIPLFDFFNTSVSIAMVLQNLIKLFCRTGFGFLSELRRTLNSVQLKYDCQFGLVVYSNQRF